MSAVELPESAWARAWAGARAALHENRALIDALNVFPVPDGDTGSNLCITIAGGVEEALAGPHELAALCATLRRRFTADSRGNSGFIAAVCLDALLAALEQAPEVDAGTLRAGLEAGRFAVTQALTHPREGTMLTVLAGAAEALAELPPATPAGPALEAAERGARAALSETPALLPLLRRAGVVDAGGLGLCVLIGGLARGLAGAPARIEVESQHRFAPDPSAPAGPGLTFRYCTEGRFALAAPLTAPAEAALRDDLAALGDSLALLVADDALKLHVHTDDPERALARVAAHGTELHRKIDDMELEVAARLEAGQAAPLDGGPLPGEAESRVLALVPGPGFAPLFEELGAAVLVWSEQLPSTEEIAQALAALPPGPVLLLPNHANVQGSARLALAGAGRTVQLVETRSVADGLGALYLWNPGAGLAENAAAMPGGAGLVQRIAICESVEDRRYGAVAMPRGHFFAVAGEEVIHVGPGLAATVEAALLQAAHGADDLAGRAMLTLCTGRGWRPELAAPLEAALAARWPELEVTLQPGGQSRYLLLGLLE